MEFEFWEENIPNEDSDIEEFDEVETEECDEELHLHQNEVESRNDEDEEEVLDEFSKIEIRYNSQSLPFDSIMCDETMEQELQQDNHFRVEKLHQMIPDNIPTIHECETFVLDQTADLRQYRSSDKQSNDTDTTFSLHDKDAPAKDGYFPRLKVRRKIRNRAHPYAKHNPHWESEISIDPDRFRTDTENEAKRRRQESTQDIQTNLEIDDQDQSEAQERPAKYIENLKMFKVPSHSQWDSIFKVLHNDSFPHLYPVQAPNKIGQTLYKITIEGHEVTTLLDLGASHSFITREWTMGKGLDLTPLRPPRPVGLFSGQKNFIRHIAMISRLGFREHTRTWKFYVIDSAPFPCDTRCRCNCGLANFLQPPRSSHFHHTGFVPCKKERW